MGTGERKFTLYSYGERVGDVSMRHDKKGLRERINARFEYHRKILSEQLGFEIEELRKVSEGTSHS